ncbi:MAG: ATP-binding cassette domain-containing protein [Bacilli bacterium]
MLELKNIKKTYELNDFKQKALDGVSLSFRECEFASILGPSGSGKTTLLNIIGGLDKYTSGDLIINNISTRLYKDRDWDAYRNYRVGFVFQSYNLISHQSILSNVELALTLSGVSSKERIRRAKEALIKVGLKEHINKKPNQLSGGQMQRVAIARALVNDPDIILADEPTGALDSETSVQIMNLLKEVSKEKLVIMVTHNPELAKEYSTRIIKLKDGKVTDDSNPYNPVKTKIIKKDESNHKTSMSLFTALGLSFNNLMTKKGRTTLVSFAGSIGIIGIALILALSNGFQNYIDSIQDDTLSSYPLTITSSSADMTSLFLSMMDSDEDGEEGIIKEKQYMTSMFGSMSVNDLKSFKKYYEKEDNSIMKDISSIKYGYSVTPNIYTIDSSKKLAKLNPSSLMSTMYSSNMSMSISSFSSVFTQMTDDIDKLNSQYDILEGKWPEKYNEMVIVLPDQYSIPDLLVYSLGLRDMDELTDMITKVMSGEDVKISHESYNFTYKDLMNIKLKLINRHETYKYNSKYKIYEDMTDDEEYMMNLYNESEDLKIVGIVSPKKGTTSKSLNPGVAYKKELIYHVIDNAKNSKIVKTQLYQEDIDVFSNKRFDSNNKKSNLNFEDMISVDEKMLKDAFNIKIDQNDIKNSTTNYMNKISSNITVDTTTAKANFMNSLTSLITGLTNDYITNPNDEKDDKVILYIDDIDFIVDSYINSINATKIFKNLEKSYVIPSDVFKNTYQKLLVGYLQMYVSIASQNGLIIDNNSNTGVYLDYSLLNSVTEGYMGSSAIIATSEGFASKMTEASMQKNILTEVGNLTNNLVSKFSNAFNVDQNKIAKAFKFNLNEDELKRLMSSMMTKSESSYSNNLINLGYQDLDEPTMISFYFNSFDSKENFIKYLDNYNEKMKNSGEDDKEIKYTDTTGILMSSVKKVVNTVSYVLIAFVSISLVVSSIMIAIITYISVLERTKEIGILRAVGASKSDISHVFNAETFIEGLISGLFGIGITLLLCIPINIIIEHLINVSGLASLPFNGALLLIILSVVLTLIAGIIPSRMASRRDPVEALRTE